MNKEDLLNMMEQKELDIIMLFVKICLMENGMNITINPSLDKKFFLCYVKIEEKMNHIDYLKKIVDYLNRNNI